MLYLHHPLCLEHDPGLLSPEHPDRPERLEAIEAAVSGLPGLLRRRAPAASDAELALVHTAAHIGHLQEVCAAGGGAIDADTFVGPASLQAARHAAGGALAMVRALVSGEHATAFCALRPAGHHADAGQAMGFCLFNNVALAAEMAIRELGLERVMIIDWDVHHGNGTAEIFRRRSDVLFASIHQTGLFPGTGALADSGSGPGRGYTVNVPVPRFSGEDTWISVLEHVLIPIGRDYQPQLLLISAGFDAHRDDPLADCTLEADSFGQLAAHVRALADELQIPIGAVLEGGYDPAALATSVAATITALQGRETAISIAPELLVTPRAASHLGHRWRL